MAHHIYQGFALIGSIWSTYYAVKVGVTVVDIFQRWRTNDWEV